MIENLSNYAFSLVSAIFILNIIQMLLPESKNRRYVLFVSSMIVTIILIEPLIKILNQEIEVTNILKESTQNLIETTEENMNNYYEQEVLTQYKTNIENGIIERLKQMGYETQIIKCEYNETTIEPEYLYLELTHSDGEIVPVKIEVMKEIKSETENESESEPEVNEFSTIEKFQIKEMISKEYGIKNVEVKKWTK